MKRKRLITAGLLIAVCVGVVVSRAVWEGRNALHAGDVAEREGELEQAVRHWRRAARWYVPGAPHVGNAYDRLENLARAAEQGGQPALALAAWRGVRGSIFATRSVFVPHSDRLEPANQAIARLMAGSDSGGDADTQTPAEREAWHLELLRRDDSPSVLWSIIALLGFAMWIGGGVLFALRGVSTEDQLVGRTALLSGLLVTGGLVVWMLGLHQA